MTVAGIALVAALAGCTSSQPVTAPSLGTSAPAPSSTRSSSHEAIGSSGTDAVSGPQATGAAAFSYQPVPKGTVVATGDFAPGGSASTTGHVVVRNVVGDEYDVILTGFHTNLGTDVEAALDQTTTPSTSQCLTGSDSIDVGAVASGASQTVTAYLPPDKTGGDPSNLVDLALAGANGDASGCGAGVEAVATLTWTFPPPYRHVAVVDEGPATGAEGTVTTTAGAPTSYVVAPDDTMAGVLKRFGISIGQLDYLNPGSFEQGVDSVPQSGFTWNLSASAR